MPATIIDYEDTNVEVHRVVVGPMDNNVYIVRCRATGDAMLIDAANEHDLLLELCRSLGVSRSSRPTGTGTTSRPSRRYATPGSTWP